MLVKCPRCELNYIEEGEGYCKICKREMRGERQPDEIEMCSICNEHPCMPGKDICLFCQKEIAAANESELSDDEEVAAAMDEAALGLETVSTMDEIIPEIEEDIPPREYSEIENGLSLDEMGDDEAKDDDDEDEDGDGDDL